MNSHNGSAGLDMTFPLWGEFCGYLKVFRGYADSLIDYSQIGVGFTLNNIF